MPNRTRWIPEIIGVGVVAVLGAVLWSTTLGPQPQAEAELPAETVPFPGHPPIPQAPAIRWKTATAFQKKQATASIVSQLEAFKKNDYIKAVKFQSSMLRRNFASVEQFRGMMKAAYPQFANYGRVEFGKALATPDGKMVEVDVRITGLDGVTLRADYVMRLENGLYRVDGVTTGQAESTPAAPGISA